MPLIRPFLALGVALALALPAKAAEEDAGAYLAARSAVIASDYAEATSWFTRALITDPSNVQLLDGALIGRLSMGDFEGAVAIAPRLIQLNNASASANITMMADQAKRGAFEDFLKKWFFSLLQVLEVSCGSWHRFYTLLSLVGAD